MGADTITLYDICPDAKKCGVDNCGITSVTDDTRKVQKGSVFVCIKGASFDGHSAAQQMLENGAAAVITERDLGLSRQIIRENTRAELARLASRFYGEPTKKLALLGVTGTNGKTTVAHYVKHILTSLGKKCGCIGTAGNDTCGGRIISSPHGTPTTPPPTVLYSWFAEMVENGAEYCVMEASSQALAQYRIGDEDFAAAGFTNLTRDHLDYHKTMENYFAAKRRLLTMTERPVICIDGEYGERLAKEFCDTCITYSAYKKADLYAEFIKQSAGGTEFILMSARDKKAVKVNIPSPGIYNVQNALCAVGIASTAGFDICECAKALKSCKGVDGRLNPVYKGDFTVITDYAHTDDALSKMLAALRPLTEKQLICVFGAAGERDSEKRPLMGKAVSQYADYIIVTSDNPAHENAENIIEQVCGGIDKAKPYEKYTDRRQAIRRALDMAQKGDVVVLAGKGHEKYQIIGDEYLPFCEADIVNEIMEEKGSINQ